MKAHRFLQIVIMSALASTMIEAKAATLVKADSVRADLPTGIKLIGVVIGSKGNSLAVIADAANKRYYLRAGEKLPVDPRIVLEKIKEKKIAFRLPDQRLVEIGVTKGLDQSVSTTASAEPYDYALEKEMIEKIQRGETTKWENLDENEPETRTAQQLKSEAEVELKKRVSKGFTESKPRS